MGAHCEHVRAAFPHYAPPEFWAWYPGEGDLPEHDARCPTAQHPYARKHRAFFEAEAFTQQQVRGLRKGYLACISFVDHQLGRLVDAIAEAGLSATTNVAYASDHGEMLGKFGMWWKCCLYEDAARVPMIAAGPDCAGGRRVATPVDLHDLRASLFAATGATQPSDWLGTPLQGMPSDDPQRVVFSEYHGHAAPGSAYLIRKGDWKYVHYVDAPCQLFDLKTDPQELEDLAPTHPDKVHELLGELHAICSPEREHERAESFINRQLDHVATTGT